MISGLGTVCCMSSFLDFGSYRYQKISSPSKGEVSNLESIVNQNVSRCIVAWQARSGTVLALSLPVVLPQFSFEFTAER